MFERNIRDLFGLTIVGELWSLLLAVGLILGLSTSPLVKASDESQPQFEIVSCSADDVLTEKFRQGASRTFRNSFRQKSEKNDSGKFEWNGADSAYSIPIGTDKTLWLFGDTFLRSQNKSLQMINNSIAIQKIGNGQINDVIQAPLKFFWRQTRHNNHSFFEDANVNRAGHWLWPLDGFHRNGKVFEFINEIRKSPNASASFSFDTSNQMLVKIENVMQPAEKWKMTFTNIEAPNVQVGNAVTQDEQFACIYCSYHPAKAGVDQHPQIIIRLPLDSLDKIDARTLFKTAEVWSSDGRWGKTSTVRPKIIMQDGAPEFSVSRAKGLEGYFAVYFPSGFGTQIMLRHATRPEGPWSEPQCIYDCPVDTERFFVYSAKSHPELCAVDGEFCVTYCQNVKSSECLSLEPERFYFPHAIKLRIKQVSSRSELIR